MGTTWEWVAPSGELIVARIEGGQESIYVGPRLVSRAMLGAKPEGHPIPAKPAGEDYRNASATLVVTYDPAREAFELRANGRLVALSADPLANAPLSLRPSRVVAPATRTFSPVGCGAIVIAVVAVGVIGALFFLRYWAARAPEAGQMASSTGLVRFHYPAGFAPKSEKSDSKPASSPKSPPMQSSYLSANHYRRDEGIFVLSVKSGLNLGRDPWVISNGIHKQFDETIKEKLFEGKSATLTETDRQEATCLGQPGAAVTAAVKVGTDTGTMWTCCFLRDGDAFMIGYFLNKNVAADEPMLRSSLEQSELVPK